MDRIHERRFEIVEIKSKMCVLTAHSVARFVMRVICIVNQRPSIRYKKRVKERRLGARYGPIVNPLGCRFQTLTTLGDRDFERGQFQCCWRGSKLTVLTLRSIFSLTPRRHAARWA